MRGGIIRLNYDPLLQKESQVAGVDTNCSAGKEVNKTFAVRGTIQTYIDQTEIPRTVLDAPVPYYIIPSKCSLSTLTQSS